MKHMVLTFNNLNRVFVHVLAFDLLVKEVSYLLVLITIIPACMVDAAVTNNNKLC